tara:strand:- start:646 stop:780 length:135 start_codon:yes stop_codon:yes gene_type:complete
VVFGEGDEARERGDGGVPASTAREKKEMNLEKKFAKNFAPFSDE